MPIPKPETGESKEDYLAKCHKFLHDENKTRDEKRPDDQISAICYEQWREYARGYGFDGEPIPILRSFEKDGKKYVYGYAAIFNTPDAFGTVMTREVVDSSIPHLTKFPAARFMHRDPFAQIVFNRQVDGFGTFVDEHGFHVLCEVYDHKENEWSMVQRGGWGFSFGFFPNPNSSGFENRTTPDGRTLPHFANGLIYEVSVVDTPAHEDAVAYAMRRMIDGHKGGNFVTNDKGVEKSMEKKEEMEQWLKDAEKRIFDKVTEAINAKKTTVDVETSLKAMEERILIVVKEKLAEKKEPTQVEKTLGTVQKNVNDLHAKVEKLRDLEKRLKEEGEDVTSVQTRITQLEKQSEDIIKSVESVVERKLGKVDERLAAIENIPDLRSPATMGEKPSVHRGMGGFGEMLEAARRGTQ